MNGGGGWDETGGGMGWTGDGMRREVGWDGTGSEGDPAVVRMSNSRRLWAGRLAQLVPHSIAPSSRRPWSVLH